MFECLYIFFIYLYVEVRETNGDGGSGSASTINPTGSSGRGKFLVKILKYFCIVKNQIKLNVALSWRTYILALQCLFHK